MAAEEAKKVIANKRRSRTQNLNYVNRLYTTEIDPKLSNFKDEDLFKLLGYKDLIEKKLRIVDTLSSEITDSIENQAQFETECDTFMDDEAKQAHSFSKLTQFIKSKTEKPTIPVVTTNKTAPNKSTVKLPKLILKKFDGNKMEWNSFYESFKQAVHNNDGLSDIERMNYLVGYLSGEAETSIKGLQLKAENYKVALELLEKRFGDKQSLVSAHMTKLMNLPAVTSVANTIGMRTLYDELLAQVRNLESLGVSNDNYGPMLLPVLMHKLPEEIGITISREFDDENSDIWDITKLLQKLKREIQARERIKTISGIDSSNTSSEQPFSGNAFVNVSGPNFGNVNGRQNRSQGSSSSRTSYNNRGNLRMNEQRCIFCSNHHNSWYCNTVSRPETRKDILRKGNRCFRCFKRNHVSSECRSGIICSNCRGNHNKAICTFRNNNYRNNNNPRYLNQRDNSPYNNFGNDYVSHNNIVSHYGHNNNSVDSLNNNVNVLPFNTNISNSGMNYNYNQINENSLNNRTRDSIPSEQFVRGKRTDSKSQTQTTLNLSEVDAVLLQTARAMITDTDNGRKAQLRVLFDSGAQLSYITPEARNRLCLKSLGVHQVTLKTFGNEAIMRDLEKVRFRVHLRKGTSSISVDAYVSDICYPVEHQAIDLAKAEYRHLQNLHLADSNPENLPLQIDVLIGSANYWDFMVMNDQVWGPTGPVALGSKLGYILSGAIEKSVPFVPSTSCLVHGSTVENLGADSEEQKKANLLKVFGNEELQRHTDDDIRVLKKFEETVSVGEDGRYQVRCPYKLSQDLIGDNYRNSYNRLINLLKNFKGKKDLLKKYDDIIRGQIKLKVVETAPTDVNNDQLYYLPHRAVVRDDKKTTSVRMVFDARSKSTKGGYSINDVLDKGPLLTPLLYLVLLRSRCKNVLINADLEKAFLQIRFHEDDRDMLRFLWVENIKDINFENLHDNMVIELRHCSVLFGLKPSPHLLCAVLRKHIRQYYPEKSEKSEKLVEKLTNALHIDDLLCSIENEREGFEFYDSVKTCMKSANFNLRKFRSNSKRLEELVFAKYPEEREFATDGKQKLFGMMWNKDTDMLTYEKIRFQTSAPSKRMLLKAFAQIFDPLGLICPVTVEMKILYQDVCKSKLGWDEILPPEFVHRFESISMHIEQLEAITIPRCYCYNVVTDPIDCVEIHSFSDASGRMYGACVYLRFRLRSNQFRTTLVTGKAKIIDANKEVTVPRAELNGVVLMCDVFSIILGSLKREYQIEKYYFWTDSSIVHCWVKNGHKEYKPYVQKRLEKIRRVIKGEAEWMLVPSKMNPADLATRGVTPENLATSELC